MTRKCKSKNRCLKQTLIRIDRTSTTPQSELRNTNLASDKKLDTIPKNC